MEESIKRFTRRSFVGGAAVATAAAVVSTIGCTSSETETESTESTAPVSESTETGAMVGGYGEAFGKHGNVSVNVLFDGDELVYIDQVRNHETPGVGTNAVEQVIQLALDGQSLKIDSMSGATLSSYAAKAAIAAAIDNAGKDSKDWQDRELSSVVREQAIPTDVDVVVIGSGGAGLSSAIKAHNGGKNVIVLEKLDVPGGSTSYAVGAIAAPGNWIQKKDGIEDSPELMAEDMLVGGDNQANPELVDTLCQNVTAATEWLTFEGGVAWEPLQYYFGGNSVTRALMPRGSGGFEYITKLTDRCGVLDIPIFVSADVTEIIASDGTVTGVKVMDNVEGTEVTINAESVIIASGGYASNVEMRSEYVPEYDDRIASTASVGAEGDGITMAQAIGANAVDLEFIQTYPVCDVISGSVLEIGHFRLRSYGFMFNKEGDRFIMELGLRNEISDAVTEQTDGIGYMIWDQYAVDNTDVFDAYGEQRDVMLSLGQLVQADTIEEAASSFGIDTDELVKTVDKWNGFVDAGEDTDFGYTGDLHKIQEAPYYVLAYKPSVHYTMGGLNINTDAQVLDTNGNVINNLYAAGEVTGDIQGNNRLGGMSLADIFTFGLIAGTQASK